MARVGRGMKGWQAGQEMVRVRRVSRYRRAAGRLRPGGKGPRSSGLGGGGPEEGVAPDQADQHQMAVEAGPGAALIIAQAQFLFPVLVEALDGPVLVGEVDLLGQRVTVQVPGEVPFGLAGVAGQRVLADQPAERAGDVSVGPVDPEPAGLPLAAALLRVQDRDCLPLVVRHGHRERLGRVEGGDLGGIGVRAGRLVSQGNARPVQSL